MFPFLKKVCFCTHLYTLNTPWLHHAGVFTHYDWTNVFSVLRGHVETVLDWRLIKTNEENYTFADLIKNISDIILTQFQPEQRCNGPELQQ